MTKKYNYKFVEDDGICNNLKYEWINLKRFTDKCI